MGVILVTGYSYYGKYAFNPSSVVVEALDGADIGGYRVRSLVLPVSLKVVKDILPRVLEELKPEVALGLGLAPATKYVDLELVAVNRAYFTLPDIDGYEAQYEEIVPGGPFVVTTTLPVEAITSSCSSGVVKVRPSLSTGLYLCNVVAYMLMKYGLETGKPAGFLHIPPLTVNMLRRETEHGYPVGELVDVVKCILSITVKSLEKKSAT